ncbi:MAG: hypothetical protein HOC71_17655 [Candidatus Latescibacteria bacterium]|jgi:hypothetical protein|nr:hypothetical protein [Candidatus Latescibacterota bacterium]
MENNTIDLDQLTQPLSSNGSITHSIIDRFNTVFNCQWSFRIIEHEVRDSEVIVLGELAVNGAVHQHFGKAVIDFNSDPTGSPSMADYLMKAADDALVQCAYAFGISQKSETSDTKKKQSDNPEPQQPPAEPSSNGKGDRPLTNRQLAAIFGLGKANNHTQQEIISMTTDRYGREPSELTVSQASTIISELSENTVKE